MLHFFSPAERDEGDGDGGVHTALARLSFDLSSLLIARSARACI